MNFELNQNYKKDKNLNDLNNELNTLFKMNKSQTFEAKEFHSSSFKLDNHNDNLNINTNLNKQKLNDLREFKSFNFDDGKLKSNKAFKLNKKFCASMNEFKQDKPTRSLSNSLIESMISVKKSAIFKLDMRRRKCSIDAKH